MLLWKKAFVASKVGGIPELIHPERGEGLLVEPASTDQLSDALLCLLRDRARTDSIAERSWLTVRGTYNYEAVVSRYEATLLDAAEGRFGP